MMREAWIWGAVLLGGVSAAWAVEVRLGDLDLSRVAQGWGTAQRNRSVTSNAMAIAGTPFAHGVGTHAPSTIALELDGKVARFRARCGVDDAAGSARASLRFAVCADGLVRWRSDTLKWRDAAASVDVPLNGVTNLLLVVLDAGDGIHSDHANWADAVFDCGGAPPRVAAPPREQAVRLTPPAPRTPRINGPRVYGARPGRPFLYRIPCTGERPMTFAAAGLPAGLALDAASGVVTGRTPAAGAYAITFRAENAHGASARTFRLVAGDRLALTPPMGYNHWYTHYNRITQALMLEALDQLVSSGMADAGYQYVCVDDCWMRSAALAKYQTDPTRVGPVRDEAGNLLPNVHFPDMRALADAIHAEGLKAGLYSSPGPRTCTGCAGSHGHEAQDAKQFADWGFDFLKYDWCSYGQVAGRDPDLEAMQKPYRLMGALLKDLDRDMVFNLCQYGMGRVWTWGAEVGGHSWRTGGDLGFELNRIFEIALKNCELREHNGPGAWNDPDYLQIGWHGAQRAGAFEQSKPCPLSPNEQYSFMALWCLMAAPLFYSGDMARLDDFTLGILCNHELIEINQDPLGQCARIARKDADGFVLVKDLEDGGRAIGLCNSSLLPSLMTVTWAEAGLSGPRTVRDCWRQQDLGRFETGFEALVPPRMVMVLRTGPP